MSEVIDITEGKIRRLRNLPYYKGKSDEEIRTMLQKNAPAVKTSVAKIGPKKSENSDDYEAKFKSKLQQLQKEYSVDMNSSNDAENLKNLVGQQIQLEKVRDDIEHIQKKAGLDQEDYMRLEKLGKFQSGVLASISVLEDKLGISRRYRKDKQVDDVPQFINTLLQRAKTYYDKQTIQVKCPKDKVEVARVWLNFPDQENNIEAEFTCPNCKEKIQYAH